MTNECLVSSGLGSEAAGTDVMLQARADILVAGNVAARASRKQLTELIGQQLERIRADTLIPLLGARQRWQLLVELLLGHAEIRGGRTRDYPFSEDRQKSCRIVQLLRSSTRPVRPGRADVTIKVPEHLLVVALQMVVSSDATDRPRSELDAERFYSGGLRFLIDEVVAGGDAALSCNLADQMGLGGDQTQDAKAWNWQSRPVKLAKLLAALSCAFSRPPLGDLLMTSDCPGRSTSASSVQRTDAEVLVQQLEPSRNLCSILRRSRVRIATMQAKHVQSRIDQCQRGFVQRGASFWISHNVARLRDHFAASTLSHGTLIVDNEAKTSFVLPPEPVEDGHSRHQHLDALEQVVLEALYSENDQVSPVWVTRHFPRLLPFLEAARAEGRPLPGVLPAVEISIRQSTLLNLAFDAMEPGSQLGDPGLALDARVIDPGSSAGEQLAISEECNPACSGVLGHQRLADPNFAIPGWLRSNAGEGYGFAGIAYGLAAHTFSRSSEDGIRKLIAHHAAGRDVRVPQTQRELVAAAGIASKQSGSEATAPALAHVKLDGDGIGRLFLSHPSLCRPGVSMALEDLIRHAWIVAMARLVERFDLNHLPALLIYLGGDDLLMTMPSALIRDFMLEFDSALERGCSDTGLDVRFTFACVAAGETGASAIEGAPAESIVAVNKALGDAKSLRTVDPKPAGWMELGRLHGMLG